MPEPQPDPEPAAVPDCADREVDLQLDEEPRVPGNEDVAPEAGSPEPPD